MDAKRTRVRGWARRTVGLALAIGCAVVLVACRGGRGELPTPAAGLPGEIGGEADPELAQTLQAVADKLAEVFVAERR